jgi:hypothetical protein
VSDCRRRRSVYDDPSFLRRPADEPEPDWQPLETFRPFRSGLAIDPITGVVVEDHRPRDRWGRPTWRR